MPPAPHGYHRKDIARFLAVSIGWKALRCAQGALANDPGHRGAATTSEVHRRQGNVTGAIRQLNELARNSNRNRRHR